MSQAPAITTVTAPEKKLSGLSLPKFITNFGSRIHKVALLASLPKLGDTQVIKSNSEKYSTRKVDPNGNTAITVSHSYVGYYGAFQGAGCELKMDINPEGKITSLTLRANHEAEKTYTDPVVLNSSSVIRGIIGVLRATPSDNHAGAVLKGNSLFEKLKKAT